MQLLAHRCVVYAGALYRNMASQDRSSTQRRLRIPKALAVALLGASATVAVSFAGCDSSTEKNAGGDPSAVVPDASIDAADDGMIADAALDATPDATPDAMADAAVDAPADARPDARPDAPPPDAPMT